MKVSVRLSDEDLQFLDAYAAAHSFASRSAVLREAIRVLQLSDLDDTYGAAWAEWDKNGDAAAWHASAAAS
jgi:Arc/MetJ-type ribon-helix-helix transcriptional regulator